MRLDSAKMSGKRDLFARRQFLIPEQQNQIVVKRLAHRIDGLVGHRFRQIDPDDLGGKRRPQRL